MGLAFQARELRSLMKKTGGEGLSETIPGFGPAGARRCACATKFAPGEFVEPRHASRGSGSHRDLPNQKKKATARVGYVSFEKERDYRLHPCSLPFGLAARSAVS